MFSYIWYVCYLPLLVDVPGKVRVQTYTTTSVVINIIVCFQVVYYVYVANIVYATNSIFEKF